jgi:hypothetical protein
MKRLSAGVGLSLIVGLNLLLAGLCASLVLFGWAVYHRAVPPPAFSVRLGAVEIAAPCPPSALQCEKYPAFYAVWRGDLQPNGTMQYKLIWFEYLSRKE